MSKIVLVLTDGTEIKKATPLTVDIADENRQALAYNMLYHLMERGAEISVNGKMALSDSDMLYVCTNAGDERHYTKPHMDSEWYGANGQNYEKGDEQYTTACMSDNGKLVQFAPLTNSYEKANEMNNFMLLGFDSSVSISYPLDGEMISLVVKGRPIQEGMVNEHGELVTERFERNWANGKAAEISYDLAVNRKYELLKGDTKTIHGGGYVSYTEDDSGFVSVSSGDTRTVYRIRAIRDFGDVKAGDLGGYIESDHNLSHSGDCWVYDETSVCNDAVVKNHATVCGEVKIEQAAVISGNANVFGDAFIKDHAQVSGFAQVGWEWDGTLCKNGVMSGAPTMVEGHAKVSDYAQVFGEVVVNGHVSVCDHARMEGEWPHTSNKTHLSYAICSASGNAVIGGNAQVRNTYVMGNAHIHENAVISGHPKLGGHGTIGGNAEIGGNALIMHNVTINGNAKVHGTVKIMDKINIGHNADIQETGDIFSLKDIGKTSQAFRNHDGGVTIVHKGNAYDSIEQFKDAMGDSLGEKGQTALEKMEEHFHAQGMPALGDALESLQSEIKTNGLIM